MRTLYIFLAGLLLSLGAYAQQLSQVTFQMGGQFSHFSILTEQGVLIRISAEGKVLEWGTEMLADRGFYYAPQLQPFMGRVDYYGPEADSIFRGKVKSIGSSFFTYYSAYEEESKRGKLRSIGNIYFDYYSNYDEKSLQGKLRQLGSFSLDYYRSYEDEAVRGKLKAIGSMPVTYYSAFDDRFNSGKLKSVGPATYSWYTQTDQARGALKSNSYRKSVGTFTIVLQ